MELGSVLAENRRLQRCIGDMIGLMALPATWAGQDANRIASSLVAAVFNLLEAEFAYLHLNLAGSELPPIVSRLSPWAAAVAEPGELDAALGPWLNAEEHDRARCLTIAGAELAIHATPLGLLGEHGSLVVGSRQAGFPSQTEALLLNVAASQATIGLQAARRLGEQKRLAEELEQRVTARTRELAAANEELRRRELDFQLVVDSIPVPVAVTTPTGAVEGVNRPTMTYFGKSFDELKEWKASDLVHPDDIEATISAQLSAHRAGHTYNVQSRHRRHDGVYRWFNVLGVPLRDPAGNILRWFHLIVDIDDQKRAEQALAASESRLAQIVDAIPSVVWSAEIDGSADFFNKHYLDYTGLTLDEVLGAGWAASVHPDDRAGLISVWKELLASGQPGGAEARVRRFDGEYRWFLFRANPLRDDAGRVVKWFGINIDIEDRKRAEEALSTSEWKLRQLTETIPQMLWSALPDGSIDYCNTRLLDFTGLSADEVMGTGWTKMLHPDDVEPASQVWLSCIETGAPYQVEVRTVHPADGTYRWLLTNALPLRDGYGGIIRWYGTCIDIHDRKVAEAAIVESERNLAEIIDTIPAYVWSAGPDGGITYINRHYRDYLGLTLEDVEGRKWLQVVHPDDLRSHVDFRNACLASGNAGEAQTRIRRFNGRYRWFLNRAHPLERGSKATKWFGVTIDIEELKRTEEMLRASEWNLRNLTETIPQMLWSADPDGSCDYCNTRMLDYTGFTADEIRGGGWRRLFHPDDRERATGAWEASAATGAPFQAEVRLIHASDASYRWCLTAGLPLRDEEGHIVKWHGVCVDMHDWKQAQDELRETQAELAHATRVMTMGQLTASIAHELNQPLAGIMTNAGTGLRMLAADPPNIGGAQETARRTIRDAKRASEVIARLRALFSRRAPAPEAVDLNAAAREVVTLSLTELRRNGVTLRTQLAEDLPSVVGDRVQLQQVLLNLLLNGSEAMRDIADRPRDLLLATERAGDDHVIVRVMDSGVGFDPAHEQKLFDPFFTTKSNGMGIGLAVSRTIIESHQGRLWAKRNAGSGSTFCFSIPAKAAGQTFIPPQSALPGGMDANGFR
ncbi:PAS domain S-box protein [Enterovirga sp. CN4-39]|uniref:PAS domain S-box protein n=1 Tax=Enterovirga sp. CN4-39 TaxID=3400910 RepID=UPI003BFACD41